MIAEPRFSGRLSLSSLDYGRMNQFLSDGSDVLADQKTPA